MDSSYSPYGPIRIKENEWYYWAKKAANHGLIVQNGMIAGHLPEMIFSELVTPAFEMLIDENNQLNLDNADMLLIAIRMNLRHWVPLVAQYELSGKQIFDLGDNLVDMLDQTDIKDATLENWHSIYDSFFIRFGKRDDIKVAWETNDETGEQTFEYLDGAFIAITPTDNNKNIIKIGLSTVLEDGKGVLMPNFYIDINEEEQYLPAEEAIEKALQRRVNEIKCDSTLDKSDEFSVALSEARIERIEESFEMMRYALKLVVNSMFYLESIDAKSLSLRPGRNIDVKLESDWLNAKRDKNENKMHSLRKRISKNGYNFVYFAGHDISIEGLPSKGDETKDVATHWRRGHWRNQPYGEKNSLVKRIWLKPRLINAKNEEKEIPGHIYVHKGSTLAS